MDKEINFLHDLANECDRGTEFSQGRALGIRESVAACEKTIAALEAENKRLVAERDGWKRVAREVADALYQAVPVGDSRRIRVDNLMTRAVRAANDARAGVKEDGR